MRESARGVPITAAASRARRGYRRVPAPVRAVLPSGALYRRSHGKAGFSSSRRSLGLSGGLRRVGRGVGPDGPDEPGEFVGQSDGGSVVAEGSLAIEGPGLELRRGGLSLGGLKNGSGAVDEERPDISVSPFGNGAEPSAVSAGVLAGRQTEEVGYGPARREPRDVDDAGVGGRRAQESDSGDGFQDGDNGDLPPEAIDSLLDVGHPSFERGDLLNQEIEDIAEMSGQEVVAVADDGGGMLEKATGTDRDREAELPEADLGSR